MAGIIEMLRAQRDATAGRPAPTVAEMRAFLDSLGDLYPVPGDVTVTEVDAGGVPARWLEPPGCRAGRALLYLHGGGYQTGSFRSHGELAARLGRAAGLPVLFPEYRLAPEHPYPAAVEDAVAAWDWLGARGVPPGAVAVAGDSAGGGLAAALAVALRDGGRPGPGALCLLSPWTDLTLSGPSITGRAGDDPYLTAARLSQMAQDYLAGADARDPLASPHFAGLDGLAPMLIQVGTAEVLLSDAERLAARATAAGVPVTLEVEEGLPHVYQVMVGTPEAEAATVSIAAFLRRTLG